MASLAALRRASTGVYAQRSYACNNAGNITTFEGAALGYNDPTHKHAVTHAAGLQGLI